MRYAGLAVISAVLMVSPAWPQSKAKPQRPKEQAPVNGGSRLDANQTLFALLAAANLSGYDTGIDWPSNSPLRQKIRQRLESMKLSSIYPLRTLLRQARPKDPASELYLYVEFSILSAGPPDFTPARSDLPRPPSLQALDDLPPLLEAFYKEAHLDDLWKELQPDYDAFLDEVGPPVNQALVSADAYLRGDTALYLGHRFLVWAEPQGAPNQVMTFGYMDDYNVVVTPSVEPPVFDVRHAYLHYVLDPVAVKYSADLQRLAPLYDYSQNAPLVAQEYTRNQWVDLAAECFIKAVESRIDRKPALAQQALKEGYLLTPAFAEQLAAFEAQDTPMRIYFPDLVAKIDLKHEEKRVANVQFASERAVRTVHIKPPPAPAPAPLTGAAKTLDDAEKEFNQHAASDRKMDSAKELFLRALQETDQKPMHAKAYYGLARSALAENDPDAAERLFHKALDLDPDPVVKSWCLLYLGRLSDNMQGGRPQAQEFYKEAIAVEGAPEQVRKAAEQGLNQAFSNPSTK
jgi:tetratricopeptide (TPR) repeat protein